MNYFFLWKTKNSLTFHKRPRLSPVELSPHLHIIFQTHFIFILAYTRSPSPQVPHLSVFLKKSLTKKFCVPLLSLPIRATAPVHLKSHCLPTGVKYSEGYETHFFEISSFFPLPCHFVVSLQHSSNARNLSMYRIPSNSQKLFAPYQGVSLSSSVI